MTPFVFLSLLLVAANCATCSKLLPVVLVPGIGGSIMETKYKANSTDLPHKICPDEKDWYRVWIGNWNIRPNMADCVSYVLTPEIRNNQVYNKTGVEIRQPDFGGLYAVDTVGPSFPFNLFSRCYHDMIKAFQKVGYVEKKTLFGAPYDWRILPTEDIMQKFKGLVETAANTNNQKVVLISHSLGGLMTQYFLQKMTSDWKNKYIERWVAISTPFAGSMFGLQAIVSGTNFHMPVSYEKYHPLESQLPSLYWLLPTVNNLKGVLVQTPAKNYTVNDIPELLAVQQVDNRDILFYNKTKIMERFEDPNKMTFPGEIGKLKFNCLISRGKKTPELLVYKDNSNFTTKRSTVIYGDGDETVNFNSLLYGCQVYQKLGAGNYTIYDDITHGDMTQNAKVVEDVINIVCGN